MRLLRYGSDEDLSMTTDLVGDDQIPPYAILSHTWEEGQEVTFKDWTRDLGKGLRGYHKIIFCAQQAKRDGLSYFWVDTCCIDKSSSAELSEAINSMYKWYREAARCYVYLSDVSSTGSIETDVAFSKSRWFTRGWTLQELLAPTSVQFFTKDGLLLGDKSSLVQEITEITGITPGALQHEEPLTNFSIDERMRWARHRRTRREEDEAYSLLGIFDVQMPMIYGEGRAKAFKRLQREIDDSQFELTGRKMPGNVHWMVPRTVNSLFTGRAELVDRIQDAFRQGGTPMTTEQKRLVITGVGGQGKSEICIKVANLMRDDFWGIFWVDVSNQSTAQNGFIDIAKVLRCPIETVRGCLQALASTTKRWLLILDNADDPRFDYSEYFPPGTRGTLIMTSRIPECRKYSTVEPEALEGLELTHSTKLLLKAAQVLVESWPSYTAPAQEIVQLLGSHTLAIIQAGAYIAGGYCRLSHYPERYRQQRKKLLEHYPDQERSRYQNVYATFEASGEVLKLSKDEAGIDALELLAILSALHSSVFPLALFKDTWVGARAYLQIIPRSDALPKQHLPWRLSWRIGAARKGSKQAHMSKVWKKDEIIALGPEHAARLPGLVGPEAEEWDDYRLRKASALLASLSLVTRHLSDDFDGLSMHPLAHAWAKDRLEKKQQQQAWTSAACLVAFSRKISGLWQEHGRMLQPHMQSLIPLNPEVLFSHESHRLMLPIVMNCGWLLHFLREDRKLQSLLEGIYQGLEITPWVPSEEYLPIWTLASRNQLCLHNTKLAIVLLEYVIKAEKTILMETDPENLITHYNLACAYSNDGQFERAIPILEHVAKVYETALPGDTHSFWLLSSQIELARAYNATGRNESGVALLEHVVMLQEAAPTGVNPQRLFAAKHSLATAYNANKQTKEALALLEEVTKVYESTLEETHIARLSSQYELARSYLRDEQVSKALVLLEHVVNMQKTTLGENHPTQIASQFMLAMGYKTNKQVKEARELLEHVVRISEKILDEKHPDRLVSEFQLALAYMNDGEREKATMLMEHVVEMCTMTLVSTHPLRKQSEEALADFKSGTTQGSCS